MENARDFDPPDPRTIDMSPRGMMASTSRAMPTDRLSAVSIMNGGAIIDHEAARERRFVAVEK